LIPVISAQLFGGAKLTTTTALDLAVYGCLMVGVVGIIKATAGYDRPINPILSVGGQKLWIDWNSVW